MKLYRVVPNIFSTGDRLKSDIIFHAEAIYYKLGFAYFAGNVGMNKHNNLFRADEEVKEGKFFYLFSEDAIKEGYILLTRSHNLKNVGSFYLIEYDFPAEMITKHFGFGDYCDDNGMPNCLLETYIDKDDFLLAENSKVIFPNAVSDEDKEAVLTTMLSETLLASKINSRDFLWYDNYFNANYWQQFREFISDPANIKLAIKDSNLYFPSTGFLIQSEYLTGRILLIDMPTMIKKYGNLKNISEYFLNQGLRYDASIEQDEFKKKLISAAGNNPDNEKDKEEVLTLLRSRKYI